MALVVGIGEPLAVFTAVSTGPVRMNSAFTVNLGGAECNVAVAATRLGHRGAVVGRVGDDPLGAAVAVALRGEGVDVTGLRFEASAPTGVMFKELRTSGRVRVSYARRGSAGSYLAPTDLSTELLDAADVVHSTGVTASFGDAAREAILYAFGTIRRSGGRASFDVNYRARLWASPLEAATHLRPLIAETDVMLLTVAEAAVLLGLPETEQPPVPELMAQLHELGPAEVVLKLDAENVAADVKGELHQAHASAVGAIDPVGAGDAFAAGYLCSRLEEQPIGSCLEVAMELGRWAVSTEGDHAGLPLRAELGSLRGDDVAR